MHMLMSYMLISVFSDTFSYRELGI